MARKPRIYYPGAFYHVMLRGNGGHDIFFSDADHCRFALLLQEGVERYHHRIHGFCQMTNHVHLVIQVGEISLSPIMQNVSFRYTRYINAGKKRVGHLFQGRYKALLIDGDSYLMELLRYIHNNPVRAGLANDPGGYRWSSHMAYLGKQSIPWLTTDLALSQLAGREGKAWKLYGDFVQDNIAEAHRCDFHSGTCEGRILGDENFSKKALLLADEKRKTHWSLPQIIDAVCLLYGIDRKIVAAPGKKQPGAEARAMAAYLVHGEEHLSLTDLGNLIGRDLAALSRAAGRIRMQTEEKTDLADKIRAAKKLLAGMSKCQACPPWG